jgi:hypothetical protein
MADFKAECPMREAATSNGRSALLIRCSDQEANLIRSAARLERRTLSGYVHNAVVERMTRQSGEQTGPTSAEHPVCD